MTQRQFGGIFIELEGYTGYGDCPFRTVVIHFLTKLSRKIIL